MSVVVNEITGVMHKEVLQDFVVNLYMAFLSQMLGEGAMATLKDLPNEEDARKILAIASAQMRKEGYKVNIRGDMVIFYDLQGKPLIQRKPADNVLLTQPEIDAAEHLASPVSSTSQLV